MPFWALGTSRSKSVDLSNNELAALTAPTAVHVVPLLIEYCHVPVPATTVVTAMPCTAPASLSVICPLISVEIKSPVLVILSSFMVVKLLALVRTGALLTTVVRFVVAAAMAVMPPFVVVLTLTRVSVLTVVENDAT